MEAYAILDGGGVKGAALVGGLQAAKENGIEFIGYGGTSAGSIIALLACIGIKPDELRQIMVNEINFINFLDGSEPSLNRLKDLPRQFISNWSKTFVLWRNQDLLKRLNDDLGLCDANFLKQFLLNKIAEHLPELRQTVEIKKDVTFNDLIRLNCPPLKIVASDIKLHKAVVYPSEEDLGLDYSVIDAVRASMTYPFVFCPVKVNNRFLVDGGLSTNLPIFLFEEERRRNNIAVIAFDLVDEEDNTNLQKNSYGLKEFFSDLLATSLESSDNLIQKVIDKVYRVSIHIPRDIDTLDFSLPPKERDRLFDKGYRATKQLLDNNEVFRSWKEVRSEAARLRALYGRHDLVINVLDKITKEIQNDTQAENVRSYIMLPTAYNTLIVVYQYGMGQDPDIDWEISLDAGCSGLAWSKKKPLFATIDDIQQNLSSWQMKQNEFNKIRSDRKVIFSTPMFNLDRNSSFSAESIEDLDNLGILSIDTSTPLQYTNWESDPKIICNKMKLWADILSLILN